MGFKLREKHPKHSHSTSPKQVHRHPIVEKLFSVKEYLYYVVPIAFLAIYVFFKNSPFEVPFGILAFLSILFVLFRDLLPSDFSAKGILLFAKEIATAFLAALVFWYALSFLLGTQTPLNVVTSCSMLPAFQRGDLVVIQGGNFKAPEVDLEGFSGPVSIRAEKTTCTRLFDSGAQAQVACTYRVLVANSSVDADKSNDVVVFESRVPGVDLIVHRLFAKIIRGGNEYYLTKGDNNNALDQETGLGLVPKEDVHGKVILRIPLVGYVKLLLFGQFKTPPGCEYVLQS